MNTFERSQKIVVKVGTSNLTYSTGRINYRRVERFIKVLADLANSGKQLVLVSSGAISVGCGKLGIERPSDTPSKQAAAAVGQCELMYLYDNLFSDYHHTVAQVLLTKDVVDDEVRRRHVTNTFNRLLELGTIPIVNENDTVAVEELEGDYLRFGDNDTLSAIVAELVEADVLVLISDIDGLYTANPREDPNAELIPVVEKIDDRIMAMADGVGSSHAVGGMVTKIKAAQIATGAGVDMAIISGDDPNLLYRLFDGEQVGTHFVAKERG